MAYSPVVGDLLEIRIYGASQDQVGINALHYNVTAVLGGGLSQQQIAGIYDGNIAPIYKSLMCSLALYRGIAVQKMRPSPRRVAEFSVANTGAGTNGATMMPRQTTGLIHCQTNLAGPRYRGRAYLMFPAAQSQQPLADAPTPAYVAAAQTLANFIYGPIVMTSGLNAVTLSPVLFNRAIVAPRPPQPETTTPIVAAQAGLLWATQRRRGDYGRANVLPF